MESSQNIFQKPQNRRKRWLSKMWVLLTIWTKNSFFILRLVPVSKGFLCDNKLSTSSINITEGWRALATTNMVRTRFSLSPIHLDVSDEDEILKKVDWVSKAIHFPIKVFPVPGGPKSKTPFGTFLKPLNTSGFFNGQIIVLCLKVIHESIEH